MKRFAVILLSFLFAAGCLAVGTGCDFSFGGSETGGTQTGGETQTGGSEVNDVTKGKNIAIAEQPVASVEFNEYLGYSVEIKGALKNTGKRDYSYVSISFTLYDESGANIGQAFANMNNLAAGETWKYNASSMGFFDDKPVRWRYAEIVCF